MDWERPNVIHPVGKPVETKSEVSVPSTEGMPPLSDITKHKGKRRNRTGSLNAFYTSPECRDTPAHRDNSTLRMPPLTRIRRTPIAGGSWDDNSVGHGSVAARMRRERNRAILRTQSTTTNPLYHSVDTHANVTSTLNLINTTSLSPLPCERFHDNSEWLRYLWDSTPYHSAATKSSAGSMCNIPVSGYQSSSSQQPWDTLSIPELHSTKSCDRTCHRTHHRHSYSSGYANTSYLHSSPTSGCASIASSDLDSADFMYFNINDDSSYFDGDSLFAESLGMLGDNDPAFSTNILSLLEEGSISCRTPFPASDWPDSISELDFDCSEGKSDDVTNCDALSDIGPSCSSPPQRRRMAKRQSVSQSKTSEVEQNDDYDTDEQSSITEAQPPMTDVQNAEVEMNGKADSPEPEVQEAATPTDNTAPSSLSDIGFLHSITELNWKSFITEEKEECLNKLNSVISDVLTSEEQLDMMQILAPNAVNGSLSSGHISSIDVDYARLNKVIKYLDARLNNDKTESWDLINSPEQNNGTIKLIKQKKVVKYNDNVPSCSYATKHSFQMEIAESAKNFDDSLMKCKPRFYESTDDTTKVKKSPYFASGKSFDDSIRFKHRYPGKYLVDEASAMKQRIRPGSRQETSSVKSADTQHSDNCSDPLCSGCSTNLRRSNSDGNLPKSIGAEAQKEHRRQQRQARRWAKWLKTRQRKENRQLLKEHRSGLFVNERKVKLKVECREEVDIEVS
ncbi:uncharacterized protein LOC120340439 [Styela clava]